MPPLPPRPLIVAAVEAELEPLRRLLAEAKFSAHGGPRWLVTGVGKINAALSVEQALSENPADGVLLVGCAGGYHGQGLEIGDVVVATEDVLADEGVESPDGFLDLEQLGFSQGQGFGQTLFHILPVAQPSPEARARMWAACSAAGCGLHAGRLVTVSSGAGTDTGARQRTERWEPLAESLEGAAVALVAARRGLPCVELRGISNWTGKRDRSRWQIETACSNVAVAARALLEP